MKRIISYMRSSPPRERRELILLGISGAILLTAALLEPSMHGWRYGWFEYLIFGAAYLLAGGKVLYRAVRNLFSARFLDEHLLMTIATAGAFAIHELTEAVAVMIFYKVGELLQDRSVERSRSSIRKLLDLQPETARIDRDGEPVTVAIGSLTPGDIMIVRPGERVPTDGRVLRGNSTLDTSALTGEPAPIEASAGSELLGGYLNGEGLLHVEVTKPASSTSAARIADLVEHASQAKARTEQFITRFARYYTPAVVGIAATIAIFPPLFIDGASFETWVYRALTMLVISCPCALVVSIPLSYFAGIGGASAKGILVKGAAIFDALAKVTTVVFDKTGTLTHGEFGVQEIVPHNGYGSDELMEIAAAAESGSNHPIAHSIRRAYSLSAHTAPERYEERRGHGVIAYYRDRTIAAGNDRLMHAEAIPHDTCAVPGTVVHLAVDGAYAGYLVIGDRTRSGVVGMVSRLKSLGVGLTAMLTGDRHATAQQLSGEIGIDRVWGDLLPEDKVTKIAEIIESQPAGERTAFLGDGMNDAPVLARSDVGVAMGLGGSEAAIDTADVVLMSDDPSKIGEAIARARKTRRIVIENIVFSLGVKVAFLTVAAFGYATMWEAVIADVGVTVIAVLNATRALR
jgi:Zn2+/Cd2+-exporting ATPase